MAKKLSEFGAAFAAARKAGLKEFTFKGKKYHTRTKEEEEARKKASSTKSSVSKETKQKPSTEKKAKMGPRVNKQTSAEPGLTGLAQLVKETPRGSDKNRRTAALKTWAGASDKRARERKEALYRKRK